MISKNLYQKIIIELKKEIHSEFEKLSRTILSKQNTSVFDQKYHSCSEVARMLKVSKSTIWNWRNNGKLPSYRLGSKVYFKIEDISLILEGSDHGF